MEKIASWLPERQPIATLTLMPIMVTLLELLFIDWPDKAKHRAKNEPNSTPGYSQATWIEKKHSK